MTFGGLIFSLLFLRLILEMSNNEDHDYDGEELEQNEEEIESGDENLQMQEDNVVMRKIFR
jgi:hypothetical protein